MGGSARATRIEKAGAGETEVEVTGLVSNLDTGQKRFNVGTLVVPTTKAQYAARSVPLPPKLYSHNDQQSVWQAGAAEGATSGWGGRIGDLMVGGNGNATFTAVSVAGTQCVGAS